MTVELDGGQLEVHVGEDLGIEQTGWAKPVFEGCLSEEFVAALGGEQEDGEQTARGARAQDA